MVAGSSLSINWMDEHIPAIINAWYPGESGFKSVISLVLITVGYWLADKFTGYKLF